MKFLETTVGIDPSGGRLAAVAMSGGLGRPKGGAPSFACDLKAGSAQGMLAEAEGVLREFVAKYGLAGSPARLCIPADRVFVARTALPPLKDKDVRPALSLELERLFPVPSSQLGFAWRSRISGRASGRALDIVVTAAPLDFVDRWKTAIANAGLRLAGAVPAGTAVSAACNAAGLPNGGDAGMTAVLRGVGGQVECTLIAAGEPFFVSAQRVGEGTAPAQAFSLAEEGLSNAPCGHDGGVDLIAPAEWNAVSETHASIADIPCRFEADAGGRFAGLLGWTQEDDRRPPPWEFLGAIGAALADKGGVDLLDPGKERAGSRLTGVLTAALAVAAVICAGAWPATVALKTRAELARLDAEVARLGPAAARVDKTLGEITRIEENLATLRDASTGRDEMLSVLLELTNRLPQGTWLSGLRVENRKVEMDGMSPSASEIFPLLTRDERFRGVEFAAPITRQGADNLERFQIRAEYVRPRAAAPVASSATAPARAARAGGRP